MVWYQKINKMQKNGDLFLTCVGANILESIPFTFYDILKNNTDLDGFVWGKEVKEAQHVRTIHPKLTGSPRISWALTNQETHVWNRYSEA